MTENTSSSEKAKKQTQSKTGNKTTTNSKAKYSKTTTKQAVKQSNRKVEKLDDKEKLLKTLNSKIDKSQKESVGVEEEQKTNKEQVGEIDKSSIQTTTTQQIKQKLKQYSRNAIITVSALSYLIFFLPFIFCREEPFAKYHLNQALVLWIFAVPLYLVFAFIPNVNIIAIPIVCMFHILGIIIGISYAIRGKAKHLPLIGRITIIKWEG